MFAPLNMVSVCILVLVMETFDFFHKLQLQNANSKIWKVRACIMSVSNAHYRRFLSLTMIDLFSVIKQISPLQREEVICKLN